jgi:hypothetical protein
MQLCLLIFNINTKLSAVIAVRMPKKLKKELQELNIDCVDDVRECLERKVKTEKLKRVMKEIDTFRIELCKKTGTRVFRGHYKGRSRSWSLTLS